MTTAAMEPIHPGEVLMLDYLEPLGVTQHRVAVSIGVPPRRINEIVHGKRGITADTALRLARYFGTSERFWLNLQSRYELEVEREELAHRLASNEPPHERAVERLALEAYLDLMVAHRRRGPVPRTTVKARAPSGSRPARGSWSPRSTATR